MPTSSPPSFRRKPESSPRPRQQGAKPVFEITTGFTGKAHHHDPGKRTVAPPAWIGWWISILIVPAVIAALAMAACDGADEEPQDVQLDLEIEDGKLSLEEDTIRVNQGDNVTFRIKSDQAGGFHLHGYNFITDVGPGTTEEMKFEADATGRFVIKLHPFGADRGEHDDSMKDDSMKMGDGEDEEITLVTLEVLPR